MGGSSDHLSPTKGQRVTEPLAFDDVAVPFAAGFLAKRVLLGESRLDRRQMARVSESLSDDLKKLCDVVTPEIKRPLVSRGARDAARKIDVDLCRQVWHGQLRFDPERSTFHLEHVVPIKQLRQLCLDARSARDIVTQLERHVRVAWILKSENRELTRLGYSHNRPDPDAAYREAGIELLTCHAVPSEAASH